MKKKRFLVLILVILVLVSIGCNRKKSQEPSEINYRTGTQGLVLTFPTNTPTKVYENDRGVKFVVEVRNKGAFPQAEEIGEFRGNLWIGGFDGRIVNIFPRIGGNILNGIPLVKEELEGKSPYNKDGGYSAVEFEMDVMDLPQGMPFYRPSIIFTASYFYKTIASPTLCVDPEPRSTMIREKSCTLTQSINPGSQGAPVQITQVTQDVTSSDILFKIYIQNSGGGLVIDQGDIDGRNPNEGYDWRSLNFVFIEDVRLGNLRMTECRPSMGRDVHLIDDKGYIFCRMDKAAIPAQAYQTPINIILSYGYTTSIQRDIEIFEEVSFR